MVVGHQQEDQQVNFQKKNYLFKQKQQTNKKLFSNHIRKDSEEKNKKKLHFDFRKATNKQTNNEEHSASLE